MNEHPVYAHFGGSKVRIGTAIADGDGSFTLQLGGLSMGPGQSASSRSGASGAVFPPFGRKRGQPIAGCDLENLEWYAKAMRQSVADPGKATWRDKNQAVLDAIEAEITRQGGTVEREEPRPSGGYDDADLPF